MHDVNKFRKRLSLLYFSVLGLVVYLHIAPFLIVIRLLSLFVPKLMDGYYFIMLFAIRFYLWISPLKYQELNLGTLRELNQSKCLIISNHRSHLDMFLFLAQVYKVRAVANSYLLKVPLLGQVLWMSGHFVMEAGNIEAYKRALVNIGTAFKRKDKVLFFAEGTRAEPGFNGIQKFRMTAFQIARENGIKIIPVVLSGTDKVWPKGELGLDFSHPVKIKALAEVDPLSFENSGKLAQYIHELMEKELQVMSA